MEAEMGIQCFAALPCVKFQSNSLLCMLREKATVLNLDFIKAIVTAEEVLLADPLNQEVIPFVDQLKQQLPYKSPIDIQDADGVDEGLQRELPFEFQVLEIALEVVCTHLDNSVTELERDAYTILDELTRNVSTKNLKYVRSLKSHLTCLLARVQKVMLMGYDHSLRSVIFSRD
ncbi:magnesium transporter MRS2-4-like [Macadamia integrifolia]|uniref:magnesium transporter MRS2-4-like n=1 Tax=Macadamia integrifolia TaxID=60698 RepID=UPI001C52F878|nr:magnesium transporter MRS2-4-like [Macadamia integrifolia]